jgi:hypothetical protein
MNRKGTSYRGLQWPRASRMAKGKPSSGTQRIGAALKLTKTWRGPSVPRLCTSFVVFGATALSLGVGCVFRRFRTPGPEFSYTGVRGRIAADGELRFQPLGVTSFGL